jgi:outer membrane protein assembly factor BamB
MPEPGDLDGDGAPDIACGRKRRVVALSARTGSPLRQREVGGDVQLVVGPADLDADGTPDLVALSGDGRVTALRARSGQVVWSQPTGDAAPIVADLVDVTDDGACEVLLDVSVATVDGRVRALSCATGREPRVARLDSTMVEIHGAGDVDGDRKPDVVAGTSTK